MLLNIRCQALSQVKVHMDFEGGFHKTRVISLGDLVDATYNGNGIVKEIIGRVSAISTVGTDPNNWYIIVDGSDDFATRNARFSPMTLLDIEIIRKADQDMYVRTPLGETGVPYIREMKGRFQISKDGYRWFNIKIDDEDIIEPQEGTVPLRPGERPPVRPAAEDDEIEDAVY